LYTPLSRGHFSKSIAHRLPVPQVKASGATTAAHLQPPRVLPKKLDELFRHTGNRAGLFQVIFCAFAGFNLPLFTTDSPPRLKWIFLQSPLSERIIFS
jgi:hypothetical protein